jgi:hypothetical protein
MAARAPRATSRSSSRRATILRNDLAAIGISLHTRRMLNQYAGGYGYDIRATTHGR